MVCFHKIYFENEDSSQTRLPKRQFLFIQPTTNVKWFPSTQRIKVTKKLTNCPTENRWQLKRTSQHCTKEHKNYYKEIRRFDSAMRIRNVNKFIWKRPRGRFRVSSVIDSHFIGQNRCFNKRPSATNVNNWYTDN